MDFIEPYYSKKYLKELYLNVISIGWKEFKY